MTSLLKITQDRVITAHNIALARHLDQTGEIKDPDFAYSIGAAVGQVFKTLGKSRSQATKDHHKEAKKAVWEYHKSIRKQRDLPACKSGAGQVSICHEVFDPEVWDNNPIEDSDLSWPDNTRFIEPSTYVSP